MFTCISSCVSKNVVLCDCECFCYIAHVNVHIYLTEKMRIHFQNLFMCWRYVAGFPLVERGDLISEIEFMPDPNLTPTLDSY